MKLLEYDFYCWNQEQNIMLPITYILIPKILSIYFVHIRDYMK